MTENLVVVRREEVLLDVQLQVRNVLDSCGVDITITFTQCLGPN